MPTRPPGESANQVLDLTARRLETPARVDDDVGTRPLLRIGHLPGENGVLALLERRGYSVTRVY